MQYSEFGCADLRGYSEFGCAHSHTYVGNILPTQRGTTMYMEGVPIHLSLRPFCVASVPTHSQEYFLHY